MSREHPTSAEIAGNIILNALLNNFDADIRAKGLEPEKEMALIAMLQVLAFRRVCAKHNVIDRGKRMKLIAAAMREMESRLREHGVVSRIVSPDSQQPGL